MNSRLRLGPQSGIHPHSLARAAQIRRDAPRTWAPLADQRNPVITWSKTTPCARLVAEFAALSGSGPTDYLGGADIPVDNGKNCRSKTVTRTLPMAPPPVS